MFGILSVLAEYQRELIVANTRDGLSAARTRGRRVSGPRSSVLTRSNSLNACTTQGNAPPPRSPTC